MLSQNSGKNGVGNAVGNAVVSVGALTPHPRNYNQHSQEQVADLRRSLRRFGQVRSIVVQAQADPGRWLIVAGHGIVAAARAEGIESLRADVIPADWNDAMVLAYLAADNELARQGQPDEAQLAALLRDVQAQADRELAALAAGSEARLTEMLATLDGGAAGDAEPQVDRAAELNEKWQVKPGDLWRIGEHRLACGDCTDRAVVERVMGGERAELLLTDPPYGIDWDTDYTRFTTEWGAKLVSHPTIVGDNAPFDPRPWLDYPNVILWGANWYCSHIPIGTWLVWDKRHKSGAAFLSDAELAWQKGKQGVYLYAETVQGGVRREHSMHPTQKPVGLMAWCIVRADKVSSVLDPFLGSGTTLVACQNLGRRGRGIEISPEYCAVVLERMATAFPGIEIERMLPRAKMDLDDENGAK